jgi:hypothetical protein
MLALPRVLAEFLKITILKEYYSEIDYFVRIADWYYH